MTKEEITKEYQIVMGKIAQVTYRFFVPFLEFNEELQQALRLNRAMHAELEREKAAKAEEDKLKLIQK